MDHEFVLVTDQPDADYGPGVRIVSLWDDFRDLPGWRGKGHGCWHRLNAFDREVGKRLGERFVWMDLDCVVVGSLDPVFDRAEDFVAWKDSNPPTPYCGSMIMMDAGARQAVWDDFRRDPEAAQRKARRYIGTDQAWIGAHLGPGEATWTSADGVYNFRHDIVRRGLPTGARVVFFTGPVDPSQAQLRRDHPWIDEHWHDGK